MIETSDGIEYRDVLRVTVADGPERQFKAGQQQGGNFKCLCGVEVKEHRNISHCFSRPHISIQEKQNIMLKGAVWRRATVANPNPLKNATKQDLKRELDVRRKPTLGEGKQSLTNALRDELHGQQRLPDFLFNTPRADLSTLSLCSWEIPEFEFMHDFTNFFSNFMEEMPHHIDNTAAKKQIEQLFSKAKGDRQTLRGCDARLSAIHFASLAHTLYQRDMISSTILQIAQIMPEISEIAYSSYNRRTQRSVLRFHNLTLLLSILMQDAIPTPKKLSSEKFFGSHFHSTIIHAPMWYRLFCIRSLVPETEEATFHKLRSITQATSSKASQHVIKNCMVRHNFKKLDSSQAAVESRIKAEMRELTRLGNTHFSYDQLKTKQRLMQDHFIRIADYLKMGQVYWRKTNEGIEFLDSHEEAESQLGGPALFHFRTHSMSDVRNTLDHDWQDCVQGVREKTLSIPLYNVKIYQRGRLQTTIRTAFIGIIVFRVISLVLEFIVSVHLSSCLFSSALR